jgi:hypothetical protein
MIETWAGGHAPTLTQLKTLVPLSLTAAAFLRTHCQAEASLMCLWIACKGPEVHWPCILLCEDLLDKEVAALEKRVKWQQCVHTGLERCNHCRIYICGDREQTLHSPGNHLSHPIKIFGT